MLTAASIPTDWLGRPSGTLSRIDDHVPHRPRSRPLSLLIAVGLVLLFMAVQIVVSGLLIAAGIRLDDDLDLAAAAAFAGIQLVSAGVGLALIRNGFASAAEAGLAWDADRVARSAIALVPVFALVVLPSVGYALASGDPLLAPEVGVTKVLVFVALAASIGLNEELWFRGLIVHVLGGSARPWWTLWFGALLFGLPHALGGAAQVANAGAVTLAVGVPFVAVRLRHHTIWAMVIWHCIVDSWAFIHTSSITPEGNPTIGQILASFVLPALVAAGYVIWLKGRLAGTSD